MFLKVKGFAFGEALTFYSRSRLSGGSPLPSPSSLLCIYNPHRSRTARKAGCDRWLVRRRIPALCTTHQPIYLPTSTSFPHPLRSPLILITPSCAALYILQALKRLFNIRRGAHALYTSNSFVSFVMLQRDPSNPI